ncbi:MAG: efflux RND transporter periplasmic adaptor subunit [Leucothrix sp.]
MKQLILIIALVAGSVALANYLIKTKPEPRKRVRQPTIPVVEVMTPITQSYTQKIRSSGSVETNLSTNLVSEVSGKVVEVTQAFQEGSYFKKGQHLLSIDSTDYRNAIVIAKAEVSQRRLDVKNEQNLARLAVRDFKLLGNNRRPGEMASRKPHLAAAIANLDAAKTRLQQAKNNLKKTKIVAPYTGRLQSANVNIGQFVSTGTQLGQVYSTDYVEVRLPLSLADYEQLKLPENYKNQQSINTDKLPKVIFSANYGSKIHRWEGRIVRASAAMDQRTRQIPVIARIDDPFNKRDGDTTPPIKIGQFLKAEILGSRLNNVYIIPTASTRQNREVMLYDDGIIKILPIEVITGENDSLVIKQSALPPNAKLIITPMPSAKTGMKVRLPGEGRKRGKKGEGQWDGKSGASGGNWDKKPAPAEKRPNKSRVTAGDAPQPASSIKAAPPRAQLMEDDGPTVLLSTQQRARLMGFVEQHPRMPEQVKQRIIKQLQAQDVPKKLVERLKGQMAGKRGANRRPESTRETN